MLCRHCLENKHELYDCPPKGSTPQATCGCAEPICRTCADAQGVIVRRTRSKWDRASESFDTFESYWSN